MGRGSPLLRALGARPWYAAPLLLRRQFAVLAAVAVAAAVLAATGAAAPLYASSVGTAALTAQDRDRCPDVVSPYATTVGPLARPLTQASLVTGLTADLPGGESRFDAQQRRLAAALTPLPATSGAPLRTLVGIPLEADARSLADPRGAGVLVARPGFLAHVHLLGPRTGEGVLVPDSLARYAGLRQGGPLLLRWTLPATSGAAPPAEGRTVPTHVSGIYRDLTGTTDPFWCQPARRPAGVTAGRTRKIAQALTRPR